MDVFLLSALLALTSSVTSQLQNPSVEIPGTNSRIFGKTFQISTRQGYEFLGIPFARPPVDELRLQRPQTPLIKDDYYATEYKPACVQDKLMLQIFSFNKFHANVSEDCLYLNVYVPTPNAANLPVMVWIHGGGFIMGSGASYDGRVLATKGQVIVITVNYRLGLFGFFPVQATEGTLGIQDQIMALKWVQKSISAFGGDPNEVTIFGESAGGASASILSVSPPAKGLFKRVIAQSGVASCPWSINPEVMEKKMDNIANKAQKYGCKYDETLDCLKNISLENLAELNKDVGFLQPQIDEEYILPDYQTAQHLVHEGLEFIMGTVPNEGSYMPYSMCTNSSSTECDLEMGIEMSSLVNSIELYPGIEEDENVVDTYNNWYPMPSAPLEALNLIATTKLITDSAYKIPTNRTATFLYTAGHPVYVYVFNAVSNVTMLPKVPWSSDAQHADELPFLFTQLDERDDALVSDSLVKLWTDFAKGRLNAQRWPRFTSHRGEFLYIDESVPTGMRKAPYFADFKNSAWRHYFQYGVFPTIICGSDRTSQLSVLSMVFLSGLVMYTNLVNSLL